MTLSRQPPRRWIALLSWLFVALAILFAGSPAASVARASATSADGYGYGYDAASDTPTTALEAGVDYQADRESNGARGAVAVDKVSAVSATGVAADAGASGGDHIVLGKSLGLAARAAKIGGRHLMGDPHWEVLVVNAIEDPNTKISVALDTL